MISASVIINALQIVSVDGFKRITNYNGNIVWKTFLKPQLGTISHTIKAGLVAEVYACPKND